MVLARCKELGVMQHDDDTHEQVVTTARSFKGARQLRELHRR